jgi:hypothetical protein
MSRPSLRLLAAATALMAAGHAHAVDLLPRAGLQLGNYSIEGFGGYKEQFTGGPTFGLTAAGDTLIADFNVDTMPVNVGANGGLSTQKGWRAELAGTLGLRVHEGIVLIAGMRTTRYGTGFGKSDTGEASGPFFGVNFPDLRLASSTRDIMSLSIAIQQTTFNNKLTQREEEADVGVNIRLGYRRAGSPHSFGLRYQSFGGDTYQEYATTLQYSYVFSSF